MAGKNEVAIIAATLGLVFTFWFTNIIYIASNLGWRITLTFNDYGEGLFELALGVVASTLMLLLLVVQLLIYGGYHRNGAT